MVKPKDSCIGFIVNPNRIHQFVGRCLRHVKQAYADIYGTRVVPHAEGMSLQGGASINIVRLLISMHRYFGLVQKFVNLCQCKPSEGVADSVFSGAATPIFI